MKFHFLIIKIGQNHKPLYQLSENCSYTSSLCGNLNCHLSLLSLLAARSIKYHFPIVKIGQNHKSLYQLSDNCSYAPSLFGNFNRTFLCLYLLLLIHHSSLQGSIDLFFLNLNFYSMRPPHLLS